jgi:PKD repeat protein
LNGTAPLEIIFSVVDQMAVKLVKWMWYFGDGSFSTEREPKHRYVAPGIYTVTLNAEDEYGNTYRFTRVNYIYVYDYTLGDQLLSGYTDVCIKHSVKATQGNGVMPYGGKWLWPMIIASTAKGFNANHENLSLVINSDDMRIYRIGIPELWTDRAGTYEETEIQCEAMLPEIFSRSGEHENVRHVETHVSMRSWDELRYRRKTGYTDDGFRKAHKLSIEAYENGEQIISATKLRQIIRNGDFAFLREVEAKRIQLKLIYTTSAFRTIKIATHAQEIDKRTPPQLNDVPEKQWQKEFSGPDIWFSRNKPNTNTNRADGEAWVGNAIVTTGPDSKNSAFNSTGLSGTTGYTIADFIISAWMIGDGEIYRAQIAGGGPVVFSVVGDVLIFTDGIDTVQWPMVPSASWRNLAVILRSGMLELYENGRLRIAQPISTVKQYGGATTIAIGTCFDIRRIPRAITADALYYYYESVLDGGGGFLP